MDERAVADAMQYVARRVEEGRAFSFDQWDQQTEVETLHRLGAKAVDFAESDVRPGRTIMSLGGIVWFCKGEDNLRWMPVRKQYLRLKQPPYGWDLQHGSLGRVIFERDGRFIWINPSHRDLYEGGVAQWSRLGSIGDAVASAAEWQEAEVSEAVVEEAAAAMKTDLPSETALRRMTKGALVGLGWQKGVSLHMGMRKAEMISLLGKGK